MKTPAEEAARGVRVETSFNVAGHVLKITKVMEGRWSLTIDGAALGGTYRTQADAWEAGVREADKLDRPAP